MVNMHPVPSLKEKCVVMSIEITCKSVFGVKQRNESPLQNVNSITLAIACCSFSDSFNECITVALLFLASFKDANNSLFSRIFPRALPNCYVTNEKFKPNK